MATIHRMQGRMTRTRLFKIYVWAKAVDFNAMACWFCNLSLCRSWAGLIKQFKNSYRFSNEDMDTVLDSIRMPIP
jgi:hypothetical protein